VVPQDLRTEDAFHVVVPSLPGMGFSTPMVGKWTMERAARTFDARSMADLSSNNRTDPMSSWAAAGPSS